MASTPTRKFCEAVTASLDLDPVTATEWLIAFVSEAAMSAFFDITNQKFGHLTVVARFGRAKNGSIRWLARCDCGRECIANANNLKHGGTRSCGCIKNRDKRTHGLFIGKLTGNDRPPVYNVWNAMKQRCYNPKNKSYSRYGGRGIIVCERWRTFENFHADMGDPPPELSIDRIDPDGNYEPGNCRWATRKEQRANRSHFIAP